MTIRTLKIWRSKKENRQPIDTVNNTTVDLRVRFVTKGSEWHMTIPTAIFLEEKENGTFITCYGTITKPFLLSLAFGLCCPFPAFVYGEFLIYTALFLVFFTVLFVFFFNRIVYTTRDYLKAIQIEAVHEKNT